MNGRHTKSGWHKTGNSRGRSGDFIVYRPAVDAGFFAAGFRGAGPYSQAGNKNVESRDGLFAGILAETAARTYVGGLFVGKRKPEVSQVAQTSQRVERTY